MAKALLTETDDDVEEFSEFESAQVKACPEDITKNSSEITQVANDKNKLENDQKRYLSETDASSSSFLNGGNKKCDIYELFLNIFPNSDNKEKKESKINSLEDQCKNNTLWTKLQDIDCTPESQWENSKAFQLMLQSLKIDSCNILQSSFYPIISHLEVMNSTLLKDFVSEEIEEASDDLKIYIPEAQFDWSSSGLVNPLEDEICLIDIRGFDVTINDIMETEQKSQIHFSKLPDLSFMQAKSLIFPYKKNLSLQ
ncbi:uncharacterized protein LOC111625045 isoform X1 [Centruroides sculpturatus]|uniref:uncharacterized protein LOC111625045 isoform X1 n=1 Tax=Centruroides sculpturatus TaxID=218467 RepID=UPI000C6CFBAC|nr:uncharacterized protein LOC111625045 isoform X1 [Centruroides sculpturatus]XP_023223836.1 uncharacterized protein LOC111625045 isoform X1 [Centruroides sculpturatus]